MRCRFAALLAITSSLSFSWTIAACVGDAGPPDNSTVPPDAGSANPSDGSTSNPNDAASPEVDADGSTSDADAAPSIPLTGTPTWARAFGGTTADAPGYPGITRVGSDTLFAMNFTGNITVGATTFTSVGGDDTLVVRLDATHKVVWSKQIGSPNNEYPQALAADAAGNVYLTIYGGATIIEETEYGVAGAANGFVVKLDGATGAMTWVHNISGGGNMALPGLAVDGLGNVDIGGLAYNGSLDFHDGTGAGSHGTAGGYDALLAQLDGATGNVKWAHVYGGAGENSYVNGLALDSSNNIVVVGVCDGTSTAWGSTPMTATNSPDVVIAKYDSAGSAVFTKRFGDSATQIATAVMTDTAGDIVVGGTFAGTLSFGGASLTASGGQDAFIATLSPSGAQVHSRAFGGTGNEAIVHLGRTAAGNVIATGTFSAATDFGSGAVANAGDTDVFVVAVDPDLSTTLWSQGLGGTGADRPVGLVTFADGSAALLGKFTGTFDAKVTSLASAGSTDVFLIDLAP